MPIDVAFALKGDHLPADYRGALWLAVVAALPWLADETRVGLHPLKVLDTEYGLSLLPQRTKLTLRAPAELGDRLLKLAGKTLDVGGQALMVGEGKIWQLPHVGTLYSDFVFSGTEDESEFCARIEQDLEQLGVKARLICGRAKSILAGGRRLAGFPLALHSVPKEASGILMQAGLGGEHHLGCGILVQHKAITGLD